MSGIVRVPVRERLRGDAVGVRLAAVRPELVRVPVVLVVHVAVLVLHRLVDMPVLVALGDVQPDARRHQRGRGPESAASSGSPSSDHGDRVADERRGREIGAGARRPELAQRHDEEHKADAVAHETDRPRRQRWPTPGQAAAERERDRRDSPRRRRGP